MDIARYLLWRGAQEEDNDVSNMKLQKLLYYAQGFSLALNDRPLFAEDVVAWLHGPVVVEVYESYNCFGSAVIPAPHGFDPNTIDAADRELLDEVFDIYGQFSAWRLREMTHEESPWKDTPHKAVIGTT